MNKPKPIQQQAQQEVRSKVFHVTQLADALKMCAAARIGNLPNPTFTVDAEDFARFEPYMAKSYTVHWTDSEGHTIPVSGILPLFQPVRPGEPRGEPLDMPAHRHRITTSDKGQQQ